MNEELLPMEELKNLGGAAVLNRRGEYVTASEEPYPLLIRHRCRCGRKFWTREGYFAHHLYKHINAL